MRYELQNTDVIASRIKSRLVSNDSDDARLLDPLAKICSDEFSAVYRDIVLAEAKTAGRLAEALLPDYWKGPDPGVVVIHARPRQAKALTIEDEFSLGSVTLLPTWKETNLIDGDVSHMVFSSKSFRCRNLEWSEGSNLHSQLRLSARVAIGVDLPEKIENVDGLVFFFECLHDQSALFFRALPFSRWYHDGKLLLLMEYGVEEVVRIFIGKMEMSGSEQQNQP